MPQEGENEKYEEEFAKPEKVFPRLMPSKLQVTGVMTIL
jgi:hypothetical protein